MIDSQSKEREEKFYPLLIIGSYISDRGLDSKRRAGIAYLIEDKDNNRINTENKYIGAKKAYTQEYIESVALLEGIRGVKYQLPVDSTDVRIRTDSASLVEQLHNQNQNDGNDIGRPLKIAKTELSSFWAWGAKQSHEKVLIQTNKVNNYAKQSLPNDEQTYV